MDLQMQDKVYIVTGGGSGIGGGISIALAREGAIPVIFGRSPITEPVRKAVYALQPKTGFMQLSLSNNDEGIKAAVEAVVKEFGRIDGLVNCAGANDGISLEAGPDAFRQSLENNLIHYYTLAHFCIGELKKTHGSILNVSSKTALTGQGGTSAYTAAKGAQLSLTREWAASYVADGIRVNCLIPAEVWTPLYACHSTQLNHHVTFCLKTISCRNKQNKRLFCLASYKSSTYRAERPNGSMPSELCVTACAVRALDQHLR